MRSRYSVEQQLGMGMYMLRGLHERDTISIDSIHFGKNYSSRFA